MSDQIHETRSERDQSDPEQPQALPPSPKKNRRTPLIIAGWAVLVLLLAGAAYLAGSLLMKNGGGQGGLFGQFLPQSNGSVYVKSISRPQITPAPGLPTIQPDVRGIFVSRSGGSFKIGTGSFGLTHNSDGSIQAFHDGPTYEVVATKNTQIYKDTTTLDPGNTGPIQQTVAPGTLDDLNPTTEIAVWGKRTGDRYIADMIVYTQTQTAVNGGSGGTSK